MKTLFFILLLTANVAVFAGSDLPDLAKIKIAAEAGDAEAQDQLAAQFQSHGNEQQALIWYRKAAAQNYLHAQSRLGSMLLMRYVMHRDTQPEARGAVGVEARKWVTLAANAGDKEAEADMAQACLNGWLVRLDYVEAYKWGELAARGSQLEPSTNTGKTVRDAAVLKMDTAQIEAARKRVENFAPKTVEFSPPKPKTP